MHAGIFGLRLLSGHGLLAAQAFLVLAREAGKEIAPLAGENMLYAPAHPQRLLIGAPLWRVE